MVEPEWDPAKNEANIAKHGLSFSDFSEWDTEPVIVEDTRYDYGETRLIALGRIGGAPRALVFTMRDGRLRLISFRAAHEDELIRYD